MRGRRPQPEENATSFSNILTQWWPILLLAGAAEPTMAVSSPRQEQSEGFVFRFFTVSAVLLCVSCSVVYLSESFHGKARIMMQRIVTENQLQMDATHIAPGVGRWCIMTVLASTSSRWFVSYSHSLSIIRRATGEYEAGVDFVWSLVGWLVLSLRSGQKQAGLKHGSDEPAWLASSLLLILLAPVHVREDHHGVDDERTTLVRSDYGIMLLNVDCGCCSSCWFFGCQERQWHDDGASFTKKHDRSAEQAGLKSWWGFHTVRWYLGPLLILLAPLAVSASSDWRVSTRTTMTQHQTTAAVIFIFVIMQAHHRPSNQSVRPISIRPNVWTKQAGLKSFVRETRVCLA